MKMDDKHAVKTGSCPNCKIRMTVPSPSIQENLLSLDPAPLQSLHREQKQIAESAPPRRPNPFLSEFRLHLETWRDSAKMLRTSSSVLASINIIIGALTIISGVIILITAFNLSTTEMKFGGVFVALQLIGSGFFIYYLGRFLESFGGTLAGMLESNVLSESAAMEDAQGSH